MLTSVSERDASHDVVSGYYDAIGRDSVAASAFYDEPTLIAIPNRIVMLRTSADVEAYIDKAVATLKAVDIHIHSWRTRRETAQSDTGAVQYGRNSHESFPHRIATVWLH